MELVKYSYPFSKADNYQFVKKELLSGTLPKIFRSFPLLRWKVIVIADYELIKEAFSKKEVSSRLVTDKLDAVSRLIRKDIGIAKMAERILGKDDPLVKNGECGCDGIAGGPYNDFHRAMRSAFASVSTVNQNSYVSDIINSNASQVTDQIEFAMKNGRFIRNSKFKNSYSKSAKVIFI